MNLTVADTKFLLKLRNLMRLSSSKSIDSSMAMVTIIN